MKESGIMERAVAYLRGRCGAIEGGVGAAGDVHEQAGALGERRRGPTAKHHGLGQPQQRTAPRETRDGREGEREATQGRTGLLGGQHATGHASCPGLEGVMPGAPYVTSRSAAASCGSPCVASCGASMEEMLVCRRDKKGPMDASTLAGDCSLLSSTATPGAHHSEGEG